MEGADDAVIRFTVNTSSLIITKGIIGTVKACSKKLGDTINSGYMSSKRLKSLNKSNQPLQASDESYFKEDLKVIKRELKKHGVDFAFMPSHEDSKKSVLFFKAKDHETIKYGIDASFKRIITKQNKQLKKQELTQEKGKKLKETKTKVKKVKQIKSPKKSRGMPNLS